MNTSRLRYLLAPWFFAAASASAAVHYVDLNSATPTPPFTSWATAATNIQDAVDAAIAGDQILVTNGVYQTGGRWMSNVDSTTNRVAVDKSVTVQSVNGPQFTLIVGFQEPGTINGFAAIRCVYLEEGASLNGFTLTNGAAYTAGGGVLGDTQSGGVLNNCVLIGNASYYGGGAAGCTMNFCVLTGNRALGQDSEGGGAFYSVLNRCTLIGNSADYGGGMSTVQANNCTVTGSSAKGGGGAFGCSLTNCTLTGNSADYGGGTVNSFLANCIVYFNTAAIQGANYFSDFAFGMESCCTTPMPTNGVGNITNAPLFVDYSGGNLRLQFNSPCINAGSSASAATGTDLDGNPRIAGGAVDLGAYEFQAPASKISYAWLYQYGFPLDGSADFLDPDRDGMNNWQEWVAGTVPTDATSVLKVQNLTRGSSGAVVTWQSVSGRNYFLERATDLGTAAGFSLLGTNIVGQLGTTTYTDSSATGPGPFFYRVGVRP